MNYDDRPLSRIRKDIDRHRLPKAPPARTDKTFLNFRLQFTTYGGRRARGKIGSAYSLTRRSPRTSKAASPLRHEKTLKSPADASRGIVQTAVKGFQPFSRERLPALWRPHERPWASRAHAAASTRPTPRISQERRTVEPGTNDARSEKPAARVAAVARKAVGRRPQGERRKARLQIGPRATAPARRGTGNRPFASTRRALPPYFAAARVS